MLTLSTNSTQQVVVDAAHTDVLLEKKYAAVTAQAILAVVDSIQNHRSRQAESDAELAAQERDDTTQWNEAQRMNAMQEDVYDLLVIGGGQAGLATGHAARLAGLRHLILDAGARTGDAWRERYDSLTLFTPRAYSRLPGLELEGNPDGYPTKDEIADYLETYASTFDLPVRHSRPVRRLSATPWPSLSVETPQGSLKARAVVVATGPFQLPRVPEWAGDLGTPQLHSAHYRNPGDVPGARVLVVGGGNSGAQIAEELTRDGRAVTWAVSAASRYVPSLVLGRSVFWWLDVTGVLNAQSDSLRGRLLRRRGDPIFGGQLREMIAKGRVRRAPKAVGTGGSPGDRVVFTDGSTDTFEAVVWCLQKRLRLARHRVSSRSRWGSRAP